MQQPNPLSPWQIWSFDVQHKLRSQQEQIDMLESRVAALCEQLKRLEARPTYNIESIEYHFDQLKVEQLDGTLNIGMAAPGSGDESFPGSIEQLAVSKPEVFPSAGPSIPPPSETYNEIFADMNRYLDTEAQQKLLMYENELCIPLDPFHRRIVIEDVRKQVPNRILYYMKETERGAGDQTGAGGDEALIAGVLAKTKRDADAALLAYIKQLQSGTTP